jgi:hypothetical protein
MSALPPKADIRSRPAIPVCQAIFLTAGGVHVPSMIDGGFSFGQYMRNIRMNLPVGAGSQLVSLSVPGDWF